MIEYNKINSQRYREQISGFWWGEERGDGQMGVADLEVKCTTYKKISYEDILYNTDNIANML